MEPGIYPNISHDEYHAMTDMVSNSYLGRLDKCPANAKVGMEDTPALSFGRAFHSFILDGQQAFERDFAVAPVCDKRTKEGKAEWSLFCEVNAGKTILSAEDMETIEAMYGAVATHPIASKLLLEGRSEMSVFWTDEQTGLPCKCRPDRIPDGEHGVILDLKSVRSADIHAFTSACMNYGYARQAGMYIEGLNAVSNAKVDAFVFIRVEKDAPYRVEVYTLEDLFIDFGKQEFRRLIQIEAECRKGGFYPHWKNEEIKTLYLPNWAGGGL
jgi:hypothetical protein